MLMLGIETLRDIANGIFVIPPLEVIFYVAVITFYALMGRAGSCLINSFAFTFYWGFMFLLPKSFASNDISQTGLLIYVACGLLTYAFVTVGCLMLSPRQPQMESKTSGSAF